MVAGDAAADAVRRAHSMPGLAVGLHLVVIEGPPASPPARIASLLSTEGLFPSGQLLLGVRYAARPDARRLLAWEIEAQFAAFRDTGLVLDHADAHKHMHLHPTVGRMLIEIGARYGLRALRIPDEPASVLSRCGTRTGLLSRVMAARCAALRRRARRAGMTVNDAVFGIAWSGAMTEQRLLTLLPLLPDGISEIYLHPAAGQDERLRALMPQYRHEDELEGLLSPRVRAAFEGVERTTYGAIAALA